jgi:hypothetical protein
VVTVEHVVVTVQRAIGHWSLAWWMIRLPVVEVLVISFALLDVVPVVQGFV